MAELSPRAAAGLAATAAVLVFVGSLAMILAIVAGPGLDAPGYVSEAGTSGYPSAGGYRTGILALAAGIGALAATVAVSVTPTVSGDRVTTGTAGPGSALSRSADLAGPGTAGPGTPGPGTASPGTASPGTTSPGTVAAGTVAAGTVAAGTVAAGTVAAGLLALSAVSATLTGAVPCSGGCPLPPFEAATGADLVHAGAGIVGMAACLLAMVAMAATAPLGRAVRRLAAAAALLAFPQAVALAALMLLAGRGAATGLVERTLLLTAAGWLVATATLQALVGGPTARPATMETQRTTPMWRSTR